MPFLPINRNEMEKASVIGPDFVVVTGDAYVDHPSFGAAIIARLLEKHGYKVCMLPQPDYNILESFTEFGRPRLAFLVTAGNIDSMVNNYTVAKKRRARDVYSPGGKAGKRPDRASIVYCQKIRAVYKNVPIILGGLEASLRRFSHYDYWDGAVRRSVLHDSGADIAVYGMGERAVLEIAARLDKGEPVSMLRDIRGTSYKCGSIGHIGKGQSIALPDFKLVRDTKNGKRAFAESFITQYRNTEPKTAKILTERYDEGYVVQNPPQEPLSSEEMDAVHELPFMREYHPIYGEAGGVPAVSEVKFSLTSVRGCFGACNFCALGFHQGRQITARGHASLVDEAVKMTEMPDFKGYIHDVGGPTANFRAAACEKQKKNASCVDIDKKCLFPKPCKNLKVSHEDYLRLLDKLRAVPGIKKVFIRSGIRFDYVVADNDKKFLYKLCEKHISGQLKVAPEHVSANVLAKMGKPPVEVFDKFKDSFKKVNEKLGMNQFLVPYMMSSHPGATLADAVELAEYLKKWGYTPEQVQDFYPTPSTVSTCMYYTGLDPFTFETVYTAKEPREKAMQRALIQFSLPQNYELVYEALKRAGRLDLVGYGKNCLIRPKSGQRKKVSVSRRREDKKALKKKKTIRNVHGKKGQSK